MKFKWDPSLLSLCSILLSDFSLFWLRQFDIEFCLSLQSYILVGLFLFCGIYHRVAGYGKLRWWSQLSKDHGAIKLRFNTDRNGFRALPVCRNASVKQLAPKPNVPAFLNFLILLNVKMNTISFPVICCGMLYLVFPLWFILVSFLVFEGFFLILQL